MKTPAALRVLPKPRERNRMKQPHTEQTIKHTEDQQNTGNHKVPGAPDAKGADKLGGTRVGAENVENVKSDKDTKD